MNILNSIQRVKQMTIIPVPIANPIAGSMYFNGTNAFAQLSNPKYSLGLYNFTFECWIYPQTNSTMGGILSYWINGVTNDNFRTMFQSSAFAHQVKYLQASILSQTITANKWYHIAFQRSISSGMTLYIDGILISTTQPTGYNSSFSANQITIGKAWGNVSQEFFKGYMTNLRITRKVIYFGNFTPSKNKYETSQNASTNTQSIIASEVILLLKCETSVNMLFDSANNITFVQSGITFNSLSP